MTGKTTNNDQELNLLEIRRVTYFGGTISANPEDEEKIHMKKTENGWNVPGKDNDIMNG